MLEAIPQARALLSLPAPSARDGVYSPQELRDAGVPSGCFLHPAYVHFKSMMAAVVPGVDGATAQHRLGGADRRLLLVAGVTLVALDDVDGKARLISNMRNLLNTVVSHPGYSMPSVTDWASGARQGWLFGSVDATAAFNSLYVPRAERRRFLLAVPSADGRVEVTEHSAAGFGTNLNPAWFTKVQGVVVHDVVTAAREAGVQHVVCQTYLDDAAVMGTPTVAKQAYHRLIQTLQGSGFRVNESKCAKPSPSMTYTGLQLQVEDGHGTARLPADKAAVLGDMVVAMASAKAEPRVCNVMLGKLRNVADGVSPQIASALFGCWGLVREMGDESGPVGIDDIGSSAPDARYSVRRVQELLQRSSASSGVEDWALLQVDASGEWAGIVVGLPGRRLEHTSVPLGEPHGHTATSSAERELLAAMAGLYEVANARQKARLPAPCRVVMIGDAQAAWAVVNKGAGTRYGTARAAAALFHAADQLRLEPVGFWVPRELNKRADLPTRLTGPGSFPTVVRGKISAETRVEQLGISRRRL